MISVDIMSSRAVGVQFENFGNRVYYAFFSRYTKLFDRVHDRLGHRVRPFYTKTSIQSSAAGILSFQNIILRLVHR